MPLSLLLLFEFHASGIITQKSLSALESIVNNMSFSFSHITEAVMEPALNLLDRFG
jgi:hypothetical protein